MQERTEQDDTGGSAQGVGMSRLLDSVSERIRMLRWSTWAEKAHVVWARSLVPFHAKKQHREVGNRRSGRCSPTWPRIASWRHRPGAPIAWAHKDAQKGPSIACSQKGLTVLADSYSATKNGWPFLTTRRENRKPALTPRSRFLFSYPLLLHPRFQQVAGCRGHSLFPHLFSTHSHLTHCFVSWGSSESVFFAVFSPRKQKHPLFPGEAAERSDRRP